jgi:outer membrane scaffolding protein for murein synthesis (MipA/OmpV family)
MRPFACSALAACLSSAAFAQSAPLPSPAEVSNRDTLTIGAGIAWIPDYEGSNDYRVIPAGAVRGKYRGISFNTNGTYLYVDVIPGSGKLTLDAGPILGLRFDSRRHSDDPVVSRMVRRKTAIEAGAFAGLSVHGLVDAYDTLSFRLDVLHDIGNAHKSTLFDPNVSFSTPLSRKTYISLSGGAEFVSRKYADYYFGVTPADVVATGGALPLYSPNGGLKSLKTSLLVNQSVTGDLLGGLSVFGLGQYSRLMGDFKRSPIVAQRGRANQWLGAIGLAYTW